MNKPKLRQIIQVFGKLVILMFILLNLNAPLPVTAEEIPDNERATVSLYPTVATFNTYRVTLTLSNLMGSTPPSARWYDPDGNTISSGGSPVREYDYSYGSLIETRDYFYISTRAGSLKPGTYRVIVSGYADRTFLIKDPKKYLYLPLILTSKVPPGDFNKLSPENGTEPPSIIVSLEWEESAGVDQYEYCYDTTNDGACTTWESAGDATEVKLKGLDPLTTYFWQVRATNSKGTLYANGSEGSFWSFTTNDGIIEIEGMVLIDAGNFMMGCDPEHNDGYDCPSDELPLHEVYLDSYYIDKYEVTNEQYLACVNEGACTEPQDLSSDTHSNYFDSPDFYNYPVINITWQDATDYCEWLNKRLPTEAEWEKAARGTNPQAYPWGDDPATCAFANYGINFSSSESCVGDTMLVGSYPDGASPYGVFDMAGNVEEWVSDWYDAEYYQGRPDPDNNPTGPATGDKSTIRGGSWSGYDTSYIRTAERWGIGPDFYYFTLGFRCVADAP